MPRVLLDIDIVTLQDALRTAKRGLTDAYATYVTPAGKTLSAFVADNLLFPLSEYFARVAAQFDAQIVVAASEATPFGATGRNLDRWLELKKVVVPGAQFAQITIAVTGQNNAVLAAGAALATTAGARYTTDAVVNFPPGPATIQVNATAEFIGSRPNVAAGDILSLDPVTDVEPTASVVAVVQLGSDAGDENSKGELLDAAFAGDGGAGTDAWYQLKLRELDGAIGSVLSVPAGFGVGSLVLYPLLALTANEATTAPWTLKVPTAGQAAAWETAIRSKRLSNHRIYVELLSVVKIDIEVAITPNSLDAQAAAARALQLRFAESYAAGGYTIAPSEILGAVTTAPGITSAMLIDIAPGIGADADNVPVPGPAATVYALLGQALQPEVTFA